MMSEYPSPSESSEITEMSTVAVAETSDSLAQIVYVVLF